MNIRLLAWLALVPMAVNAQPIQVIENAEFAAGGIRIRASVFSFSTRETTFKVVPAAQLSGEVKEREVRISVRDLAHSPSMRSHLAGRSRGNAMLIANGGFSTSRPDRPQGLLVSEGKTLSIPNYQGATGDRPIQCSSGAAERYRFSASVCLRADGTLVVGRFREDAPGRCVEAIQTAPVLVENGSTVICGISPEKTVRTALCETRGGRDIYKLIVTKHPVALHEFAQVLARESSADGAGCVNAVNLAGADSSGVAYFAAGRQAGSPTFFAGEGLYPQASFLVITAR